MSRTVKQHLARCSCGQLEARVHGDPVRVSMCHCLACQRRTGSLFGAQARFAAGVVQTKGQASHYERVAESGSTLRFSFCPRCGSTVYYVNDALPGFLGIPIGAFADPAFGEPAFSVYERSRHPWVVPPVGCQRESD